MKYTIYLADDGGVSNAYSEIVPAIRSRFRHEFGIYEVREYLDKKGNPTMEFEKIKSIHCERLLSNREIADKKLK